MGFALMGAMPSMIMRYLGGPLCSLNLPTLGRGILLAVRADLLAPINVSW